MAERVIVVGSLHGEDLTLTFDTEALIAEIMGWPTPPTKH